MSTLCPTIFTSGAGENVAAVVTLGVPHPPGFPLFCVLGKLFTLLAPFGSPACRVNLFSAVCGAAAAAAVFLAARRILEAPRGAAIAAALLLAFSRTFWSQAVIAEVYTLNALILAVIVLSLSRAAAGGRLWLPALAFGLGLAVHPLQALFLPGWLAFLIASRRPVTVRDIVKVIGAVTLGVSLHLYAPIRALARPMLNWGNPSNLRNLLDYAMAAQYRGRMFHLGAESVMGNVRRAAVQLSWEMTPLLIPLVVYGAWQLARRRKPMALAMGIGAAITFVYAVNYDIPWEIEVYFIPIVLVMAFLCCAALTALAALWGPVSRVAPLLAVVPLIAGWHENDRSRNTVALAYGHDILATCPERSVLVAPETDAAFALLYLTAVEGKRPDLQIWIQSAEGLRPFADAVNPDVPPIREAELLERLPPETAVLHSDHIPPDAVPGFREVPWGILYRLVPRGVAPPPPPGPFERYALMAMAETWPDLQLDDRGTVILARYLIARGDAEAGAGRRDAAEILYGKAENHGLDSHEILQELGARYADLGDGPRAIDYLERSLKQHEDAIVRNRLGRLLVKASRLDAAQEAFEKALAEDASLAIAHSNLGALRGMRGDIQGALAELRRATALDPTSTMAWNNLARACAISGDRAAAVDAWRRSLAIDPGQADVRAELDRAP